MAKLAEISVRILVQVKDGEPAEIASVDVPINVRTVSVTPQQYREGTRLVVKVDPIDAKAAVLKALRKALKVAHRAM